jgi:hypothetical protein
MKLLYPAPRRGRGVYCFTSVRPSKIFFVAFFSVTVDGRNLIFIKDQMKITLYVQITEKSIFAPSGLFLETAKVIIH